MNLHTMQHGPQDDDTVHAGSLEILRSRDDGPNRTLFSMASKLQGTDALGARWKTGENDAAGTGEAQDFPRRNLDLVIMNPPFTANDKRGQKFAGDAKKKMQQHELRIRDGLQKRDKKAGAVITTNPSR